MTKAWFPELKSKRPKLADVLEKNVDDKYTLKDGTWNALQRHKTKHKAKGNGFGFNLADKEGIAKTLSARYYKDGAEILIPQKGKNPNVYIHEYPSLRVYRICRKGKERTYSAVNFR